MLIRLLIILFMVALSASATASSFTLNIQRNMTCDDNSTIGRLLVNGVEIGRTLELPWKENRKDISRIPAGITQAVG